MRKISLLLLFCVMLSCGSISAQMPMPIPNGSFEQWSSHQGYSVSLMGMNMPVYDIFSTPSLWDYMSYPVNQSVSFLGIMININTSIPLIKSTRSTGQAPDGNTAVQLQTFMLEDIIDPTMLSLASGSIDQSLIQTVIPSVLSTGVLDVDAFMPIVTNLLSGGTSIDSLLPSLITMDVNDFISGGLALGDFPPAQLTGSYKYHSATSGDNGGVILLGTHYNSTTHQRDVVGGGINLALTDINEYTPFTVDYLPLSMIQSDAPTVAPDSLVVLILSSAGNNRQQGSVLSLDNLVLWLDTSSNECSEVLDLEVVNTAGYDAFPEMVLTWNGSFQPDHWEVEYGPQGFEPGMGTTIETNGTYFEIFRLEQSNDLTPNTWYDFYVRSACDDDVFGERDSVHYRTFCASISSLVVDGGNLSVTSDNLIMGYNVSWESGERKAENGERKAESGKHAGQHWLLTFGINSSELPDNWGTTVTVDTPFFALPPLIPERRYAVVVSPLCGDDNYGMEKWAYFNTPSVSGIGNADAAAITVCPNPASSQCSVFVSEPAELKLYSLDGRLLQTTSCNGDSVVLQLPSQGIFLLHVTTSAGTTIHKIVGK